MHISSSRNESHRGIGCTGGRRVKTGVQIYPAPVLLPGRTCPAGWVAPPSEVCMKCMMGQTGMGVRTHRFEGYLLLEVSTPGRYQVQTTSKKMHGAFFPPCVKMIIIATMCELSVLWYAEQCGRLLPSLLQFLNPYPIPPGKSKKYTWLKEAKYLGKVIEHWQNSSKSTRSLKRSEFLPEQK